MRKFFELPEMNISCFDVENIVTESGNNVDLLREEMENGVGMEGIEVKEVDVISVGFTF